ncbi:MAG: hypothetical protein ACYDGS_09605 [Thermoleophilia bacterium]
MRSALIILMTAALLLPLACGTEDTVTPESKAQVGTSAHQLPEGAEAKVIADATDDLKLVTAAGADPTVLPKALTGQALEDMKSTLAGDQAQGKYKKRDYQNIKVRFQDYLPDTAQVYAEFDDVSYYVDAKTGAALEAPSRVHKAYALALVEEENHWKIKTVLAPSDAGSAKSPGG